MWRCCLFRKAEAGDVLRVRRHSFPFGTAPLVLWPGTRVDVCPWTTRGFQGQSPVLPDWRCPEHSWEVGTWSADGPHRCTDFSLCVRTPVPSHGCPHGCAEPSAHTCTHLCEGLFHVIPEWHIENYEQHDYLFLSLEKHWLLQNGFLFLFSINLFIFASKRV